MSKIKFASKNPVIQIVSTGTQFIPEEGSTERGYLPITTTTGLKALIWEDSYESYSEQASDDNLLPSNWVISKVGKNGHRTLYNKELLPARKLVVEY